MQVGNANTDAAGKSGKIRLVISTFLNGNLATPFKTINENPEDGNLAKSFNLAFTCI